MMDFLRNLDRVLFSPPHTFEQIMRFVMARVDGESAGERPAIENTPAHAPKPTRGAESPH